MASVIRLSAFSDSGNLNHFGVHRQLISFSLLAALNAISDHLFNHVLTKASKGLF